MERGIIYMAISPSNKIYIGQTIEGLYRRKIRHNYCATSEKSNLRNTKFSRAIRKYGIEGFTWKILYSDVPIDFLDELEIATISAYKSLEYGYNSNIGGGSSRGYKPTENAVKRSADTRRGQKRTPEQRERISQSMMGKKRSPMCEEQKKKISESKIGDKNPMFGKRQSEKSQKKRSDSLKKFWTDDKRTDASRAMAGKFAGDKSPSAKLTLDQVREIRKKYIPWKYSLSQLAKEYKVSSSVIFDIVKNNSWIENQ